MPRLTPRRIVAVGILLLAISGVGFAIVEIMGPAHNRETLNAHGKIIRQRVFGEITREEADRRANELPTVGIGGYFLTQRGYGLYQALSLGGAAAGLALIAAGFIRAGRRSVATPPGS